MGCNVGVRIDLHIHSTASDGSLSPSEILDLAQALKLKAISITDHDTIDGSGEALQIGIPACIEFLTGVEISTNFPQSFPNMGSLHILGYNVQIDHPVLTHELKKLKQARKDRNPQIIERLNQLGVDISLRELVSKFNDSQIGRPHIAKLMVEKNIVKSMDEAFNLYIGKGKPAYVDKYRIGCESAIHIITGAGGIPVLAHPGLIRLESEAAFTHLIQLLKEMGLVGMEVYYPEHSPEQVFKYMEIANRFNLLVTGGTDFHGSIKPEIQMGAGYGDYFIPYEIYEKIKRWIRDNRL